MVERLAVSYAATGELVDLFKTQLELCQVKPGEHVLIHSDSGTYPHYPAAFLGAAGALGADVFQVVHPRGEERAVIDAWKRADLVIDCSPRAHAYGDIMKETLDSGTRILRVAVPEETLRRLTPTDELRERVVAGQRIMDSGQAMRITSPNGTDLTFHKEGRDAMGIYSVADKPGRWDIWPSGMVCCAPVELYQEGTKSPVFGKVSDISAGGCFVETGTIISAATKWKLVFALDHGSAEIEGVVVRSNPGVGVGIKFNDVTLRDREVLKTILEFIERTSGPDQSAQRYLASLSRTQV